MKTLIFFFHIMHIAHSIDVDPVYYKDVTLSASNNPYLINNTVVLDHVTLTIENGAELVLLNIDSELVIEGSIDVGCNDVDSSDVRGLAQTDHTSIRYKQVPTSYEKPTISIQSSAVSARFCNVLFENLIIIISNNYSCNNCEFHNSTIYTHTDYAVISNSWFHGTYLNHNLNGDKVNLDGDFVLLQNVLIEDAVRSTWKGHIHIIDSDFYRTKEGKSKDSYYYFSLKWTNMYITNSTFNGYYFELRGTTLTITNSVISNGTSAYCIDNMVDSNLNILSSEISDCAVGVKNSCNLTMESCSIKNNDIGITNSGSSTIKSSVFSYSSTAVINRNRITMEYNKIIHNTIGIQTTGDYTEYDDIHYNILMNNGINIANERQYDLVNVGLNYYGINTTNQEIISNTMKDACYNGDYQGIIIFWPWLIKPYSTTDDINVGYTFNYTDCNSINQAKSYMVHVSASPTTMPTTAILAPSTTTSKAETTIVDKYQPRKHTHTGFIVIIVLLSVFSCIAILSYIYFRCRPHDQYMPYIPLQMEGARIEGEEHVDPIPQRKSTDHI